MISIFCRRHGYNGSVFKICLCNLCFIIYAHIHRYQANIFSMGKINVAAGLLCKPGHVETVFSNIDPPIKLPTDDINKDTNTMPFSVIKTSRFIIKCQRTRGNRVAWSVKRWLIPELDSTAMFCVYFLSYGSQVDVIDRLVYRPEAPLTSRLTPSAETERCFAMLR